MYHKATHAVCTPMQEAPHNVKADLVAEWAQEAVLVPETKPKPDPTQTT